MKFLHTYFLAFLFQHISRGFLYFFIHFHFKVLQSNRVSCTNKKTLFIEILKLSSKLTCYKIFCCFLALVRLLRTKQQYIYKEVVGSNFNFWLNRFELIGCFIDILDQEVLSLNWFDRKACMLHLDWVGVAC